MPSRTPPSPLLITTNWPHSFFFSPLRYNGIIHLYNLMSRHPRHRARSSAASAEKTEAETNGGKRRRICAGKRRTLLCVIYIFIFSGISKIPGGKLGNMYMCHSCRKQQQPRAHHSTQGGIPKARLIKIPVMRAEDNGSLKTRQQVQARSAEREGKKTKKQDFSKREESLFAVLIVKAITPTASAASSPCR